MVSWADGDRDWKFVDFAIADDAIAEPTETFTVDLTDPAGGALMGSPSIATIQIPASDQPRPKPASSGGGASA